MLSLKKGTTLTGKLRLALNKEATGAVDVRFTSATGRVLFSQHVGKYEKVIRLRLDMNELPDG